MFTKGSSHNVIFRKRTDGFVIIRSKFSCDNYGSLLLISNKVSLFLSVCVDINKNFESNWYADEKAN